MYRRVLEFIEENALLCPGDRVIAAVSGGADSVCLLEVLCRLRESLPVTLSCAHFNHCLRGAESDGDEQFVRDLCQSFGIPLFVGSADVLSQKGGASLEEAARRARYAFLETLAREQNAVIATAHTRNDNVETFFINLMRGSGSRGLCGIPVRRGCLVRPLLETSREEIVDHLAAVGLSYRTDSTNADPRPLRNFIRLEVLPLLASRPDLAPFRAVPRAIAHLKEENAALSAWAARAETEDAAVLSGLPEAVLWRVLTEKLEREYGVCLDSAHFDAVKSLLRRPFGRAQICGDLYAAVSGGRLSFSRCRRETAAPLLLTVGENDCRGKRILIKKTEEIYNSLTKGAIDCDKIVGNLYADVRRDGDQFFSCRRRATSRLKKLLINDKVPRAARDALIVIRDSAQRIVFVEGYGVDRRCCADENSKKIISVAII